MQVDTSRAIYVLQGEIAAVEAEKDNIDLIKTPAPNTCTVMTLFDKTRKIAVMAHIDDYTDIIATINEIELVLRRKFATTLTASAFTAKVMGGTDDAFSQEQNAAIRDALREVNIPLESVDLPPNAADRPQITLDTHHGKLTFTKGKEINIGLEYLQLREYGDFNTFLDQHYGSQSGTDIPYFKARETTRREHQVPEINGASLTKSQWIKKAQTMEKMSLIKVDIHPTRTVTPSQSQSQARVFKLMRTTPLIESEPLKKSLSTGNYNLMLRQAASDPKYLKLFSLLLEQADSLPIDLTSRGATSGTVWDVATKCDNAEALALLHT